MNISGDGIGRPSDIFPELTEERLAQMDAVVRPVYRLAAAAQDRESGDGGLVQGMRLYERTGFVLERLAAGEDWIDARKSRNEWAFVVGGAAGVPIKYGYDDPANINRRRRKVSRFEQTLRRPSLFGDAFLMAQRPLARLIVHVRADGDVDLWLGAYAVGSAVPLAAWPLVSEDAAGGGIDIGTPQPPTMFPPVPVMLRSEVGADAQTANAEGHD